MNLRNSLLLGVAIGAMLSTGAHAQSIGPSTTTEPYLLPTTPRARTVSLLTVGDAVGGYKMAGIPDGVGAWSAGSQDRFNLVLNHELGKSVGVTRSHGSTGAFVSRWLVKGTTGAFLTGRDHMKAPTSLFTWNGSSFVAGTSAIDRLCSADLAAPGAYYRPASGPYGYGTQARIFLSGEETAPPSAADHGRVFAHIVSGPEMNRSYELPRLGRIAWENALASPYPQTKTIVAMMDDAGRETNVTTANVCRTQGQTGCTEAPSELYMYIGTKRQQTAFDTPASVREIDRAGLNNGSVYGVRVVVGGTVVPGENKDFVFGSSAPAVTSGRFELVNLGDVSGKTGVQLQDDAINQQVTQFIRVEDGAWDPRPSKANDFYFVTTGRLSSDPAVYRPSRLWRLRFDDIKNPEAGGTIEMLLSSVFYANAATTPDADPSFQMFDNMGMDGGGRIVLQEDAGNTPRLGRVYAYGVDTGKLELVARHNPKFFMGDAATNPNFLTADEESSGVVDAKDVIGPGWFLLTTQAHKANADPELVEGGQIQALFLGARVAR